MIKLTNYEIKFILKFYVSTAKSKNFLNNDNIIDELLKYRSIKKIFEFRYSISKKDLQFNEFIRYNLKKLLNSVKRRSSKYEFASEYVKYIKDNIIFKIKVNNKVITRKPSYEKRTKPRKKTASKKKNVTRKFIIEKQIPEIKRAKSIVNNVKIDGEIKKCDIVKIIKYDIINKEIREKILEEFDKEMGNNLTIVDTINNHIIPYLKSHGYNLKYRNIYETIRRHYNGDKKSCFNKLIEKYVDDNSDRNKFYIHEFYNVKDLYIKRSKDHGYKSFSRALENIKETKNKSIVIFKFEIDDLDIYNNFNETKSECLRLYNYILNNIFINIPKNEELNRSDIVSHMAYNIVHYNYNDLDKKEKLKLRAKLYCRLMHKFNRWMK